MFTHRLSSLSRLQAFGFHFLASAAVIAIIFSFVKLVWYPHQLFEAADGFELLKILVLVDLILGPLIMLIIFNPAKKSLKFDISTVLVCQLLFLGYGVWSLYTVRPVYIAFVEKQFYLVKANEVEDKDLEKAQLAEFKSLPQFGPMFVGTQLPESKEKQEEIMFAKLGGMGIQNLPQFYVPVKDIQNQIRTASASISGLSIDQESKAPLELIAQASEAKGQKVLFAPLLTKTKQLFVIVDAKTGAPIQTN
ncbi:TfpX/TfpZ family type IV pilin accessory protein [Undibacterium amnicola]|nr:TfpX/TfpZ family type IV pilin accessory protein [Undibacterium amnicola]